MSFAKTLYRFDQSDWRLARDFCGVAGQATTTVIDAAAHRALAPGLALH
jgi:hypothetical protein